MNRLDKEQAPDFEIFHAADVPYRFLRRLNMDMNAPPRSKHGNKCLSAYPDRVVRGTTLINELRAQWKHAAGMGRWSGPRRIPHTHNKIERMNNVP